MFGDFPHEFGHSSSGLAVKTVDSFYRPKIRQSGLSGFYRDGQCHNLHRQSSMLLVVCRPLLV